MVQRNGKSILEEGGTAGRRAFLIKKKNRGWHLGMIQGAGSGLGRGLDRALCPVTASTAWPSLRQGPQVRDDSRQSHQAAGDQPRSVRPRAWEGTASLLAPECHQGLLFRGCPKKGGLIGCLCAWVTHYVTGWGLGPRNQPEVARTHEVQGPAICPA